jgi:uncharacterized heparinase superfamily protein
MAGMLRLIHTLQHLKIIQIRFQLWYRIRHFFRRILGLQYPLHIEKRGGGLILIDWIIKTDSYKNAGFTFLNRSKDFSGEEIDWSYAEFGKLWTYNLNYFDFLNQSQLTFQEGIELIGDFISKLRSNSIALDPFTIALRGINWVKFISAHEFVLRDDSLRKKVDSSLYAQYRILLRNLEYHLLANHLLEDAFSLLFGAFYFNDKELFLKSESILRKELEEQILDDGAHFELSPMYHQMILDRLLDCINLLSNNQRFGKQNRILALMEDKACNMLSWLNSITFSNGEIPLFNDSAPGISPSTEAINNYAKRLDIQCKARDLKLSASGYRKFFDSNYECFIDVGHIGPSYQPGHSHADTFNFVLNVNNSPLIVDTGISTYDLNENRLKERGTSAHNTVTVSDMNSSQIWSSFRVGRRAKVHLLKDDQEHVLARHNGYRQIKVTHQREWKFEKKVIRIFDFLEGSQTSGKAYFILSPLKEPELLGKTVDCHLASIDLRQANSVKLHTNEIPDGYNRFVKNFVIEASFDSRLEISIIIK